MATGPARPLPHSYANVSAPVKPVQRPVQEPAIFRETASDGIYDSAQATSIPAGVPQAVYATGAYAVSPSAEKGHPRTVWIDVTGYDYSADALDIEKYDATPAQAGPWAENAYKNHPGKPVIVYTNVSNWHKSEISVAKYAPNVKVRWWIASPQFLVPHMAPGACATQWLWKPGYNISETLPCFWTPGN